MNQLIWDFGTLDKDQEADYVKALLDQFSEDNVFKRFSNESLSKTITSAQQLVRTLTENIASVSQRDFQRVFKLVSFFFNKKKEMYQLYKKTKTDFEVKKMNDNELINESVILALAVVYYFRLPSNVTMNKKLGRRLSPREAFEEFMDEQICHSDSKFVDILDHEMSFYLNQMKLPGSIAKNNALKENVFAIVVSVASKFVLLFIPFFFF